MCSLSLRATEGSEAISLLTQDCFVAEPVLSNGLLAMTGPCGLAMTHRVIASVLRLSLWPRSGWSRAQSRDEAKQSRF